MGDATAPRENSPAPADMAVTLLVPGRRNRELAQRLLDAAGIAHRTVATLDGLLERVRCGSGPLVIGQRALGERVAELTSTLEAQTEWSDVPVILFAQLRATPPQEFAALVERSKTTLLRPPLQTASFVTIVRSALADRRRQYAVRDLLDDLARLDRRNRRRIDQLQRLTRQLTRAEEAERERLASLLHDDLQQLLVGAQFRLNVLERRAADGRELGDTVAELRELLHGAIERSRSLSHELCPPPLRRSTLAEALRWLADQMRANYGLDVDVSGDPGATLTSEDLRVLVFRAVQELLFNVVKHADTRTARVALDRRAGSLTVVVEDDGRGFVPAVDDAGGEPDGLGLFGLRERAQILGGTLRVDSAPGRGCRCVLRLPLDDASERADAGEAVGAAPAPRGDGDGDGANGRLRVVVVDDHRYLREGVKALLAEEDDMEVVGEAADGREALALVADRRPDAVLLDIAMPELDGLEAARRLRAAHPRLRIVGLSTFGESEMGERMRAAGADTYVCKNDPGEKLVAALRDGGRN